MFENRRMPNGMSERARSRGYAVWEGVPCKGALYPMECARHRYVLTGESPERAGSGSLIAKSKVCAARCRLKEAGGKPLS